MKKHRSTHAPPHGREAWLSRRQQGDEHDEHATHRRPVVPAESWSRAGRRSPRSPRWLRWRSSPFRRRRASRNRILQSQQRSNTEAGAHPDISTELHAARPEGGQPEEVAKTIEAKWPTGVFGNPQAVPRCANIDFALNECPSFSQVGWIGVVGKTKPTRTTSSASRRVYDMEPSGEDETARFAFTVPEVNIPINIPIKVRTGSDYGLTVGVTGITQELPLRQADLDSLGLPGRGSERQAALPEGLAGRTRRVPGLMTPRPGRRTAPTSARPIRLRDPGQTADRQPDRLHRQRTAGRTRSSTATRTRIRRQPGRALPETTDCATEVFRPVFDVGLTTDEADCSERAQPAADREAASSA